jgi:hypothetical protein
MESNLHHKALPISFYFLGIRPSWSKTCNLKCHIDLNTYNYDDLTANFFPFSWFQTLIRYFVYYFTCENKDWVRISTYSNKNYMRNN